MNDKFVWFRFLVTVLRPSAGLRSRWRLRPTGACLHHHRVGVGGFITQSHELGEPFQRFCARFTKVYKSMLFVSDNTNCIRQVQESYYLQNPILERSSSSHTSSHTLRQVSIRCWLDQKVTGMLASGRAFRHDTSASGLIRYVDLRPLGAMM